MKLCTEILGDILSFLFKERKGSGETGKINNCIHHDVDTVCRTILEILVQTILTVIDKEVKVMVCIFYKILYKFYSITIF